MLAHPCLRPLRSCLPPSTPAFPPSAALHPCRLLLQLSAPQLETVVYASMKFHGPRLVDGKRAGFFLGDGAGVGKGRQVGGAGGLPSGDSCWGATQWAGSRRHLYGVR